MGEGAGTESRRVGGGGSRKGKSNATERRMKKERRGR